MSLHAVPRMRFMLTVQQSIPKPRAYPWRRWMPCLAKVRVLSHHVLPASSWHCRGVGRATGRRGVRAGISDVPPKQPISSEPYSCAKLVRRTRLGEPPDEPQQRARFLRAHRRQRRIGTREDEQQQCSRGPSRRRAPPSDTRPRGRVRRRVSPGRRVQGEDRMSTSANLLVQ